MTYTTNQGDTWDLISYKLYGSNFNTWQLIEANQQHKEIVVFSAGIELQVPVVEQAVNTSVAPWLRPTIEQQNQAINDKMPIDKNIEINRGVTYRTVNRLAQAVLNLSKLGG